MWVGGKLPSFLKVVALSLSIALVIFGPPIFAMLSSTDFQYCEGHQGQYPSNSGVDQQPPAVLISDNEPRRIFFSCASSFTNINAGAITGLATILLMFVTGGLVWVAWQQYRTTRAQLRAYVSQSAAQEPTAIGDQWQVGIDIRNNGLTPAYGVEIWSALDLFADAAEAEASGFPILPPDTMNKFCIFPNSPPTSHLVFQSESRRANSAGTLYLWGKIVYLDAFKTRRTTNFRLFWTPYEFPGTHKGIWCYCEQGNDAD